MWGKQFDKKELHAKNCMQRSTVAPIYLIHQISGGKLEQIIMSPSSNLSKVRSLIQVSEIRGNPALVNEPIFLSLTIGVLLWCMQASSATRSRPAGHIARVIYSVRRETTYRQDLLWSLQESLRPETSSLHRRKIIGGDGSCFFPDGEQDHSLCVNTCTQPFIKNYQMSKFTNHGLKRVDTKINHKKSS